MKVERGDAELDMAEIARREHLGDDENWKKILLCCIGEFIGNFFLNFLGCLSVLGSGMLAGSHPAFVFGLVIAVMVQIIGPLSGGHFNPAVTIAALIGGKTPIIRASCYIPCQIVGSIVGTAALMILPEQYRGFYGLNILLVDEVPGLIIELFLGFILVLVVFGCTDENNPNAKVPAPFAIGLTISLGVFAAGPFTSASINPARSLGSAIIYGEFEDVWVFVVGPIIGGILAALLYMFVLGPGLEETKGDEG